MTDFNISKEDLEELYFNQNLTYSEIEKKFNLKRGRIYHWFKKYGIIKSVNFFISKEDLEKLYFEEKLSYSQIEKKLNLKRGRIYSWFKKYKIESRSISESTKGKKFTEEHKKKIAVSNSKPHTEDRKKNISKSKKGNTIISNEHREKIRLKFIGLRTGSKHPMWKGGVSNVRNRLRQSFEYKNWRKMVYDRDNYTCQMCLSSNKYLNCHHIVTFSYIADTQSLISYDDYLKCEFLWDIDNGITLCKDCHKSINNKEEENEKKFKDIIYEKNKNVEVS